MEGYIYQIKNLINSKVYVGQTIDIEKRWSKHKSEAKNNFLKYKSALYPAIRLYGVDNFKFEVIEICDISMLDEREKYWIHKLNSLTPNGYNLTCGGIVLRGENNPFYGRKHSLKTKQIISMKNTGKKYTEEQLLRCRERNKKEKNPFYGKHHSESTKQKIIASNITKGNYKKTSERMKLNNPNKYGIASVKKKVAMLDITTEQVLKIFNSRAEAGRYIIDLHLSSAKSPGNSIGDVCCGRQVSAFGYKWKNVE